MLRDKTINSAGFDPVTLTLTLTLGGGGGTEVCAWPQSYDHRPSHPYYAGTEHVGFSSTRQTLLAPSAKGGWWGEGGRARSLRNSALSRFKIRL